MPSPAIPRHWKKIAITIVVLFPILLTVVLIRKGIFVPNEPSVRLYPIRGIDVSHHNGHVDWKSVVESGMTFAFIKATEGSDWIDSEFDKNWAEANKHGITTGAYHYFSTTSLGSTQADNHIKTVPKISGMLPPVIDIEFSRDKSRMSDDEFHQNLKILMEKLEAHYSTIPIIYTTKEFHSEYLQNVPIERLWVRSIFQQPRGFAKDWIFWQYSCLGDVSGIAGCTDLNVFRGSLSDFTQLTAKREN